MSVLNDVMIHQRVKSENIISPFNLESLQPCSYDLHFDASEGFINPPYAREECDGNLIIPPNDLTLVSTVEHINVPTDLCGVVHGKSSLGRIGLAVHITAGFVDSGFNGKITMELVNHNNYPIVLKDGCSIGQIQFQELTFDSQTAYSDKRNHYQYQDTVKESRYKFCDGMYIVED